MFVIVVVEVNVLVDVDEVDVLDIEEVVLDVEVEDVDDVLDVDVEDVEVEVEEVDDVLDVEEVDVLDVDVEDVEVEVEEVDDVLDVEDDDDVVNVLVEVVEIEGTGVAYATALPDTLWTTESDDTSLQSDLVHDT